MALINDMDYGLDMPVKGTDYSDWFRGGRGPDRLEGGLNEPSPMYPEVEDGFGDTVDYTESPQGVNVDLGDQDDVEGLAARGIVPNISSGWAEGDQLEGIENAVGSRYNDNLFGDRGHNKLFGGRGSDFLWGDAGDDHLWGDFDGGSMQDEATDQNEDILHGGHDDLVGGAGNDTLEGGMGADDLDGGPGSDTASYTRSNEAVTVNLKEYVASGGHAEGDTFAHDGDHGSIENLRGSIYADMLTGDDRANRIEGNAGNDTIYGLAGNDTLDGDGDFMFNIRMGMADGADMIDGGAGNDTIMGRGGADKLMGGEGADKLMGDAGEDELDGGAGDDMLHGGAGDDKLHGGDGEDVLYGNAGDDMLHGGRGDDKLQGNTGDDDLDGNAGNDDVWGGAGDDRLWGSYGDDKLVGDVGNDVLQGGAGADVLNGDGGPAGTVHAGYEDEASYAGSDAGVTVDLATGVGSGGHAAGDVLYIGTIENLRGSMYDDMLTGDGRANKIWGGAGDDMVMGGAGDDMVMGEAGDDTVMGEAGDDMVMGGDGDDMVMGGAGDDMVMGGDGDDMVMGGDGDDMLTGGDGDDMLTGGADDDMLTGGLGGDTFVFGGMFGNDTVEDFTNGSDKLNIEGLTADDVQEVINDRQLDANGDVVLDFSRFALTKGVSGSITLVGYDLADDLEADIVHVDFPV